MLYLQLGLSLAKYHKCVSKSMSFTHFPGTFCKKLLGSQVPILSVDAWCAHSWLFCAFSMTYVALAFKSHRPMVWTFYTTITSLKCFAMSKKPIVQLGHSMCHRPNTWVGPKEKTKIVSHNHHQPPPTYTNHTNFLTSFKNFKPGL